MIYLDTHVVVWLYVGDLSVFSPAATCALETDSLMISPVVALELTYLHEIGRVKTPSSVILDYLADHINVTVCPLAFERVITAAINQTWTRDPFDRMIVGHAAIQKCGLVTKDRIIHAHYAESIW